MGGWYLPLGIVVVLAYHWLKFPREYERLVVFRLGRVIDKPRGPGFTFVLWPIEQPITVRLRVIT